MLNVVPWGYSVDAVGHIGVTDVEELCSITGYINTKGSTSMAATNSQDHAVKMKN